ncbi:MAG: prepilin peptidase dependent protein A [Lachnospiraceae bacterium]|nr:prepilin peptidase dependent protein A [Lachnospiraceae bacterium]
MNGVSLSNKIIYWNPKDFAVSQNFNKAIRENEKVSNDYYWKSNKSEGVDCFGRALDLTTLINKPDGYLQGRLADADDADYYQFNIAEYRILGTVSDKHNLDITVTLDHIPEGCDYELVLYDGDGNQVGIGQDNGSGGKSVTVPNWNLENRGYTVKVLAKDGSPVNAEEYYHLSFQTKQAAEDNVLRQQAKEMQEYAGALRRKLHDGQDAAEEKQALQQIREKYGAYYTQQMDELHKTQAAEYLPEGEVFDESRKAELLSKMAAGGELTEQEKGLANIFASAQEIDSATASAKLQADIGEEIFRQMGQSGISPIPSFEVSIGIDGKAEVKGIEDAAVKEKVEDILNGFSGELMDTYISINAGMQGMNKKEQYILKAAMGIEAFLQKATGGKVALSDITVENGRIKGLDAPLDKLLGDPGQNQTYLDYRADILAIKNYEKMNGNSLLGGFSAKYTVDGETIRTVSV